jgi:SAM-dependent methyltransferase
VSKVVGVDTSEGMIKMWVCGGTKTPRCTSLTSLHRFNSKQAKVPGGEKMVGHVKLLVDPNDAILQGQKFDIAVTHLALHHIEDMAPVVHTLAGTLSAGGRVFLSDFENDGEHAVRFHPKSKHHDVERHGVTRVEMLEILQSAELNDVKVENSFALDKTIQETGEQEPFPFLLGQGSK